MAGRELRADTPLYRYRFGAIEFDEARQTLSVSGQPVELEQRPLQVLAELLRCPDEVVTREALLDSVWAGRPTVDNVVANAVTKLRKALGDTESARITTLPRIGYRLSGPIERQAVGRKLETVLALKAGMPVPGREHYRLDMPLNPSRSSEVWLARHEKTREPRVYKFSPDGERLAALKRETTLYRVLVESLGERDDFARILDWNFEQVPFFLECEYGGLDLCAWSETRLYALAAEARVALFLQIADAVAAAHSVGVLHKDLKPANVLVSPRGDGWQLRLTDFGSARLLQPERLAELGITRLGMTVTQAGASESSSGTPLYLAPELLGGQAPTVQSDVYALGLMLYQLLAGNLKRPMVPGWQQDIADDLLCQDIAAATDGNPARRLANVAQLAERLRQLEHRRDQQRLALAAEQRMVDAERELERARARRPWRIATVLVLGAGLATSLWFYRQALASSHQLERQVRVVQAVNDFMTHDLIGAANPSINGHRDVTVIEAAKAAMPRVDATFAKDSPEVQAALHHALQESFAGLADAHSAIDEGRKAIAAYGNTRPLDLAGLSAAQIRLASDLARLSKDDEAAVILSTVEGNLPKLSEGRPALQAQLWSAWSQVKGDQLKLDESLAYDQKAWALIQTLPEAAPALRDRVEFSLADTLRLKGEYRKAEMLQRDLAARQALRLGTEHPQTLYTLAALGSSLGSQDKFDEATAVLLPAIKGLETTLGANHRRTLLARSVLAGIYFQQHEFDQAAAAYGAVYQGMAANYGNDNLTAVGFMLSAASATKYAGRTAAAEPMLRNALQAARHSLANDAPMVQAIRYHLADCLLDLNRSEEAGPLLAGLEVAALNDSEPEPDWTGRIAYQTARRALAEHRTAEALPLLRTALQDIATHNPDGREVPLKRVQALLDAAGGQAADVSAGAPTASRAQ